jgi:hypothetical protein
MTSSFFTRAALLICLALPAASWAQVNVVVSIAPPPLPVYVQPPLPDEGYIWSPGYWAYDDGDYYWIPGTWVRPPAVGLFWTPGYWAWSNAGYRFYRGYWGPQVGFYGGVNYGYGYNGNGYHGGYWNRGAFYYNQSINNFGNRHVTRVYNKTVINNVTVNNISYNGGRGGVNARPNSREQNYAREKHIAPTSVQRQHVQAAIGNREQRASVNQGRPPIAATDRPGQFKGAAVVPAHAAGGPLPDRSQQNDDRRSSDGRPDSPQPSSRLSTSQNNPVRDNGAQVRTQPDRPQDLSRSQQQRDDRARQQREQSQRNTQIDSQRDAQRSQQQREQNGQQQQREQIQREQQIQQQREQQGQQQRAQQVQREQQVQQQRVQQAERSQQAQQQREQQHKRQAQPRQEAPRAEPPQREQRPPQGREQQRVPQGESRREGGRD